MSDVKTNEKKEATMQSPWQTYLEKINAIFGDDPQINVSGKDAEGGVFEITVNCSSPTKYYAIKELLRPEIKMGNITVKVIVNNTSKRVIDANLVAAAFEGNPHFSRILSIKAPTGEDIDFCVMESEVIQFFNDDLTDPFGNFNGLAEDILREITVESRVGFCTESNKEYEDDESDKDIIDELLDKE